MRENFGRELGKKPREIVILFAISPRRQFEHALAAGPQPLGITVHCYSTRLIRHLIHLSKKLTLRCPVPDISRKLKSCAAVELPASRGHAKGVICGMHRDGCSDLSLVRRSF